VALLLAAPGLRGSVLAQSVGSDRPPNAIDEEVNPRIIPGLVKTPARSGRNGPLAPLADRFAAEGIIFHALSIDFLTTNPSAGLRPGHAENSLYNILGVDVDLAQRGLGGSSLHYETTIFAGNTNIDTFLQQVGDNGIGYQGTYNKRVAVLSLATFEQKLFDDRLDIEIGRTHPNHYYAPPECQSLDSCFQDILYFNAGFTSPQYSVWGANVTYHATPTIYAEAGAFATNDGARIGYELGREHDTGVLGIAELGSKTDFDTEAYPARYGVTGFFNTSSHADLNAQAAFNPNASMTVAGTSGVVFQAQKVVWRADGGLEKTKAPTSIALYGSAGTALDSTTPILSDVYVGATLQSPFAGRPADRFGLKVDWERTNPNYTDYITAANLISGGTGAPYNQNKFIFEANAHIQLPAGMAFEPVVQYVINPNSFYNPLTSQRSRDGIFAIGTLVIPVGVLLGLTPG
jgi:porin